MRCKNCHYSLTGLAEHRCPECGREFDPHDHATFDTPRTKFRRLVLRRAGHVLLVCLGTYLLAVVIHFYFVSTDTTYIPDADSSPSEWTLALQLIVAGYRAAGTFLLLIPFTALLYILFSAMNHSKES